MDPHPAGDEPLLTMIQQKVLTEVQRVLTAGERFSTRRIAKIIGMAHSTVSRKLHELRDLGYIDLETQERRNTRVRIVPRPPKPPKHQG